MLKNIKFVCSWCLITMNLYLLPSYALGGEFMGILKKETAYPFSSFSGQLLFKGKPAVQAKITRQYELLDDKHEETIIADTEGRFSFESIPVKYRTPLLATVEFSALQEVFVEYQGNNYQIWASSKRIKDEHGEFGGKKPKNFYCEITDELDRFDNPIIGFAATNCHWE